ncbi:MAG: tyrosine-type recombinase/integrase [Nitrospirota bacterium]
MGLYKRKDSPVYWMSFCANNRQYQRSTGTSDKATAQKIYDAIKGKIALNQWIPETRQDEKREYTFNDLYEKYADWAEGRQRSWKVSREYMARQLQRYFGNYLLNDFNVEVIEQFQSEGLKRGLAPGGVNRPIGTLKAMFTKALDWDMITEDVLKRVRKVKAIKGERKILRYLTVEECHALIEACDPIIKPIVITALNTGMRRGEILSLKWDNVDLRHGFILLDINTKTGERREIPINDMLRATLQALQRRLDVPYVFYDPTTGKPIHDFRKRFASALRRAKITDFRFHDLRHTFASQLVMSGVDITTVSKLLGHKSLTMTLRYAHLAPSHLTEGVKKLDVVLSSKKTPSLTEKGQNYYDFMTLEKFQKPETNAKQVLSSIGA